MITRRTIYSKIIFLNLIFSLPFSPYLVPSLSFISLIFFLLPSRPPRLVPPTATATLPSTFSHYQRSSDNQETLPAPLVDLFSPPFSSLPSRPSLESRAPSPSMTVDCYLQPYQQLATTINNSIMLLHIESVTCSSHFEFRSFVTFG